MQGGNRKWEHYFFRKLLETQNSSNKNFSTSKNLLNLCKAVEKKD